ncbi:MAG: anti-sigma factor antagonist [Jaaginema sp. PMC 1079.18]|nr:anti-sigma factor antagonist [Jaaginema sp. PMC 1080.18]MEC4852020.1 anti-sigma factor antagonist [Jaaginema sp. PMC 1079.18]MEC4866112.1 anti-sigma factor antagonist [Jaaginema sp. PMC 1078.18]
MTSSSPAENFPVALTPSTATMTMPPRLSVLEAIAFKQNYQELLQGSQIPPKIILDFQQTRFMDSSGVGALVSNFKVTQAQGHQVVLHNVNPPVMAVLTMTGLDRILSIEAQSTATLPDDRPLAVAEPSLPPETHPSVRSRIKRGLDIAGSLVGLGITGLLIIPIGIAIKLDSPGPLFFGQTRCGWLGKRFTIWKFRSMCIDAEAKKSQVPNQASGAFFKNKNDPRVTRVGRFLRRTSLDELPQFWNVLKGEMSLVGTRPPTPNEVDSYDVPEWQRLDVKPGMTGEWQVHGRSQVRNFEDVIALDLRYQRQWSLRYDLKLIFKTIWVVFNRNSGAY